MLMLTQFAIFLIDPSTNEPLYEIPEATRNRRSWAASSDWSDGSWGSSEFEDDENEEGYLAEPDTPAPTKPLPRKPRHSESAESLQVGGRLSVWRGWVIRRKVISATVLVNKTAECEHLVSLFSEGRSM